MNLTTELNTEVETKSLNIRLTEKRERKSKGKYSFKKVEETNFLWANYNYLNISSTCMDYALEIIYRNS